MSSGPERFDVVSNGCRLAARSYTPATPTCSGGAVILVHGFLSSADMFDVPGREAMSLARSLQHAGFHVVTYDQRGAGGSVVGDWAFGLREHALVDLPAVISEATRRFGFDRIVLGGHSLGGTILLSYLRGTGGPAREGSGAQALEGGRGTPAGMTPRVVGAVAMGSPASFDVSFPPWSDFARRGRRFVESIDRDRDQVIDRAEFTVGQALLYWSWARLFLTPALVDLNIRSAAKSPFVAGLVRSTPIPTLDHDKHDFDNATFMYLLRSRAVHQGSRQLLLELFDAIGPAPPVPLPPIDVDALCIGSALDKLVPLRTVEDFAKHFTRARVVATEREYGLPTGHAGYFFKDGVRDKVAADVSTFLRDRLTRRA